MTVHLDHLMVPARDKTAAARQLAELLGVPWGPASAGPFVAVYLNDGLTLDFDEWKDVPRIHYCFRVTDGEFDSILGRLQQAGIDYRSSVFAGVDHQVGTQDRKSVV